MKEFSIVIASFAEVQEFVAIASVQPFRVLVSTEQEIVNAKSFIGMASLDYSRPIRVRCDCNDAELACFCQQAHRFLAS